MSHNNADMSRYVSSISNFEFIPYAISVTIFVSYKKEEFSVYEEVISFA